MKKPVVLRRSALAIALIVLFGNLTVDAGNTWDGGGTDNFWKTAANWDSDVVIAAGQEAKFGGSTRLTAQNDFTAATSFNGITFNAGAGAFTLTGNSLTLNGDINNNSTSTQTINLDLILNANRNANASTATSNIVISSVVSGAFRLQAIGLGTVTLNGTAASTYTGQTSASGNGTFIVDLSNIASHTNLITPAGSNQVNLGNGNASAAGTLIIKGAASGTSSQTLNGLQLANGTAGTIIVNANGGSGTNLNLGTGILRGAASTVVFDISSPNATLTGTTLGLTAAAQTAGQGVRGYALVKDATGTGFAANVGGALVKYTGATALTAGGTALTTASANNYTLAAGGATTSFANSQSFQSLNITTNGGAGIIDLGTGVTTVSSNALLVNGNAATTLQGGQLGATNSEVIVHSIGSGGVTIASNISGGSGSFTKTGSDTVTLTGTNTFTGLTSVLAGSLKAGASSGLSATSPVILANSPGVNLDISAAGASVGSLGGAGTVGGGVILGANTLTLGGSNAATGNNNSYSGIISGTGGLTKVGTGPQTFYGASTYTGATLISGGSIVVRNTNALGLNSAVTVDGSATLDLGSVGLQIGSLAGSGAVTNNINAGTGTAVVGSNNTSTTFSGTITNGAQNTATYLTAFTKTGAGTQTLGGANTYTGLTTVNNGTLLGTQSTGTPFGTGAVSLGTGTLSLAPTGSGGNISLTGGSLAAGTLFTYNSGATLSLNKGGQTSLTYTFGGGGAAFARGASGTFILSTSAIAGLGAAGGGERFIINGTAPALNNTLVLGAIAQDRGNNNAGDFLTYDATNGFKAATYNLASFAGSSNTQLVNISTATSTGSAAAYALKVTGSTVTNTGTLTLGGGASGVAGLILNGGTISGGTLAATSGSEYVIYTNSAGGAITSNITGASGMSVTGPGVLALSGTSNNFTGSLKVIGSTVAATSDAQLGGLTSNINLTGGTLRSSGNFALGGATGQRNIILSPGSGATGGTFEVTGGTTTFTSNGGGKVISGTGSLTKTGAGTLVLAGSFANTYTGATNVNAGTLVVNGGGTATASAVTVASGATLAGSGTVGGATSISGNHAPGNLGIGTQTFSSSLSYNSGSTFSWQLGDETPAANFDTVNVGGALNIAASGVTFNVIVTGLDLNDNFWVSDRTWDIFDSASAGAGTFDSFVLYDANSLASPVDYSNHGSFTFAPATGTLSWNSAVPEPTNALAGLLIGAGLLRRRRRRSVKNKPRPFMVRPGNSAAGIGVMSEIIQFMSE